METIFFFTVIVILVLPTSGEYTCNYLELIPSRAGWFSIEELTCLYGCCGDLWEQKCCAKPEEVDNRPWIIAVSVIGGLLVSAIIAIVLLCVLKKKNLERVKIYTGSPPPPGQRNKNPASYTDISNEEEGTAPPPYSPRRYDVFTTDCSARVDNRTTANGQEAMPTRSTLQQQTNVNMVGRQPIPSKGTKPILLGHPPAYTCLEQRHDM